MNKFKCPICDNDGTINLVVDLNNCTSCNHIFKTKEIPSESYHNYRSSAHQKKTEQHIINAKQAANIRLNFIKSFKKSKNANKLLEIGCGHTYFLDAAQNDGFSVEGTELSKSMIKEIKHKLHYGNPSEIDVLGKYDVIAGFHVLEHLNNPIKELDVLVEHLDDDGIIVLEFPNLFFETNELNPKDFYEGLHTQYFNMTSFNIFIKRCGLKQVLQTSFYDSNIATTLVCLIKNTADITKYKKLVWKRLKGDKFEY